jgi:hypothetical protein
MLPEATDLDMTLYYVELIISVELNFIHGYIAANAVLAPDSHVYVPMAHLTGAGPFYSWFGNNSHAGDWVVSIGGFPRGYNVTSHYPNPDRIGLKFTLGDCIQVMGQAYVAVTPKCAMVGGLLHMSLGVGPVSAYLDLVFDAFINFKSFYFKAQVSVSVGVECDIDEFSDLGNCNDADENRYLVYRHSYLDPPWSRSHGLGFRCIWWICLG